MEYLRLVEEQEDKCAARTDDMVSEYGRDLPATISLSGTALSLIERGAVCWWGCAGGDHIIESLVGRAFGLACGAYRLVRNGRYDEALLLIRGLGEIANLLTLFSVDRPLLVEWKALGEGKRRDAFSPVKVRLALEERKAPLAMTQTRYQKLCELSAHPGPGTKPGMHNPAKRSVLGGHPQILGAVVCANELTFLVGTTAMNAAVLLELPAEAQKSLLQEGAAAIKSVGPINAETQRLVLERWHRIERERPGEEA
jgi:hypothetical protein